jgi:hypothetical protein
MTRAQSFQALTTPSFKDRLALVTFTPKRSLTHNPSDAALHQAQDADLERLIHRCSSIQAQNA